MPLDLTVLLAGLVLASCWPGASSRSATDPNHRPFNTSGRAAVEEIAMSKFKAGDRVRVLSNASETGRSPRYREGDTGTVLEESNIPDVLIDRTGSVACTVETELELVVETPATPATAGPSPQSIAADILKLTYKQVVTLASAMRAADAEGRVSTGALLGGALRLVGET